MLTGIPLPIFRHTHIMDQWGTQIQLRSGPDLRHVTHGHAVDPGQRSQPQELCGLRVSEVPVGEKHGAQWQSLLPDLPVHNGKGLGEMCRGWALRQSTGIQK